MNQHEYIPSEILEFVETVHVVSRQRDAYTGGVFFEFWDGESTLQYDIERFINAQGTNLVNPSVRDRVFDWMTTARRYPNHKRLCIFCGDRANRGVPVCTECRSSKSVILNNIEAQIENEEGILPYEYDSSEDEYEESI